MSFTNEKSIYSTIVLWYHICFVPSSITSQLRNSWIYNLHYACVESITVRVLVIISPIRVPII